MWFVRAHQSTPLTILPRYTLTMKFEVYVSILDVFFPYTFPSTDADRLPR